MTDFNISNDEFKPEFMHIKENNLGEIEIETSTNVLWALTTEDELKLANHLYSKHLAATEPEQQLQSIAIAYEELKAKHELMISKYTGLVDKYSELSERFVDLANRYYDICD
jgi:hypothetical protein